MHQVSDVLLDGNERFGMCRPCIILVATMPNSRIQGSDSL